MKRERHWAAMGESTFVAGIWLLFAVHWLLGRTVFRLLLWPVVLFTGWPTRACAPTAWAICAA